MSSKVTAKLRLGAAFSVLLISLTLLAGCKQEADNSYTPPGYGASVGPLTDTVWKNGSDTIRFGAEGKVVDVPKKWKTDEFVDEYGDFTYSSGKIFAKVKKLDELAKEFFEGIEGTTSEFATFIVPTTTTTNQNITVTNYYEMKVTINGNPTTFTMDNKPTSGDKFVGTYYDEQGRKYIQINKDNTFVQFTDGEHSIQYWKYNDNGTISVAEKPFDSSNSNQTSSTYYLYPHALMKYNGYSGSAEAWK
ncbi:MAG: hypothetical protein IKK79_07685 [Spirochaetaceae bacterium]|nr:hypothetical protein [Spirochaetaceae bacterium]